MSFVKVILREWESRVDNGIPNIQNEDHFRDLVQVLRNYELSETFVNIFVGNLLEGVKQPTYEYMIRDIDGPVYYLREQGQTIWQLVSESNIPTEATLLTEKEKNKEDYTLDDDEKEKAKKSGLISLGKGVWGKEKGKGSHKVEKGKLTKLSGKEKKDANTDKPTQTVDNDQPETNEPEIGTPEDLAAKGMTPDDFKLDQDKEAENSQQSVNPDKIMSDFTTRSKKLKNTTPERQAILDKNLGVIQQLLDPNISDTTKLEALDSINWTYSQGDPPRKFYLKDLYDNKSDRSDKILGKTVATEKLVQAATDLYKRNNRDAPNELSSRQMGDIGKIEATQVDPGVLSDNNAQKGDFTKTLETNSSVIGKENVDKILQTAKIMRDLGHTESVYVDVNDYVNKPKKYQREMGMITVQIIKDSRNSMLNRFGKVFKPNTVELLDSKITEMEQKYKDGEITDEYLGNWYADVKQKMEGDNAQAAEAFANNMGEMYAIQDETLNGHYVVIPTAKNAKLGDKVRVMTREGASDPAMVKVLTDLMGSVKKKAKTTVGAQHTHVGIVEGCDFGTVENKLNIMTSAHSAKYMLDEDGNFNKSSFKSFIKGSKDLKDLDGVNRLLSTMGLDPSLTSSKEGLESLANEWETGLKNEEFKNKLRTEILVSAGLKSPAVKKDMDKLSGYLTKNNISLDDYVSVMVGDVNKAANGRTVKNALNAIISGKADGLDTKELQIATSLLAMTQKTKENFGYDVVEASGKPWNTIYNYGQVDGETIHTLNGSYIMGYLQAYDMNPRYGKGGKSYNVGKRSLEQMKSKLNKLKSI